MHGDTRGPVRVRICCAPFTLLRLLTLHCTRRRGAAEGEGAQQTEKGAADAKACRRRPGAVPRAPVRPGASAHGTGFVATAGALVDDIAQTPHAAPHAAPVDPDPAAPGRPAGTGSEHAVRHRLDGRPRPSCRIGPGGRDRSHVVPLTAAAAGRRLGRGSTGVIPLTATATTGMTLVSSRTVPPPSSGAGRGRLSGADPAQRPRGRAGGPRSRPPRRRVRQPGSLVMSLLVCCRLVM